MSAGSDPREVMRAFWDEKARENATYYISSYRPYDQQDDAEFWRWGETLTARLLEESGLPFTGGERVLEIGCGIGRMTVPLARRFREVVGLDVSEEMVRRAREVLTAEPNARIELGNGIDLAGLDDASFDFVFSYLVLQHVTDPGIVRGYLREIARVLKPGGARIRRAGCGARPRGSSAFWPARAAARAAWNRPPGAGAACRSRSRASTAGPRGSRSSARAAEERSTCGSRDIGRRCAEPRAGPRSPEAGLGARGRVC